MQEIRCGNCHKKLGVGTFQQLNMKCPRCKTMNNLRATSTPPACPSASNLKDAQECQITKSTDHR
ncbi:Com family DNA-binding transcriptional regulator [Collimonas antrihumi]|uniref:Com family DNA-binding transcriptional regulator n=1 Tax=Collimonas antrihumi TaxID=1940615 RepID=UPI001B8BC19C|nr:Com family DNA-binding transcriptional regulator [Collimonas antrihumi]